MLHPRDVVEKLGKSRFGPSFDRYFTAQAAVIDGRFRWTFDRISKGQRPYLSPLADKDYWSPSPPEITNMYVKDSEYGDPKYRRSIDPAYWQVMKKAVGRVRWGLRLRGDASMAVCTLAGVGGGSLLHDPVTGGIVGFLVGLGSDLCLGKTKRAICEGFYEIAANNVEITTAQRPEKGALLPGLQYR